jgi:hypothetical protein
VKLSIKLCKYCSLKNTCEFRKDLKNKLSPIEPRNIYVKHDCKLYADQFKPGDRVKIKMYNQVLIEEMQPTWEEIGEFEGVIEGYHSSEYIEVSEERSHIAVMSGKKFFIVKLDAPIKVTRVLNNEEITVEITHIRKLPKDIFKEF